MGRPVTYFEIGCRDRAATSAFYRDAFGWDLDDRGDSTRIDTASGAGIHGHVTSLGHEPHNYVMVYVEVEDLEATLVAATTLGGTTVVGPVPIEDGRFAWVRDPEGTMVGVIQSHAPAS